MVGGSLSCVTCAYDLTGLPASGACPECATPVQRSLDAANLGFRLELSSKEHVRTLLGGSRLVLTGILLMVILMIARVVIAIAATGGSQAWVLTLVAAAGFGIGLMIAAGWWKLSEPDPALRSGYDGGKPRKVVRVCVLIGIATAAIDVLFDLLLTSGLVSLGATVVQIAVGLLGAAGSIVAFFAQMLYLRWLAPRLPTHAAAKRAKTMLWLGPVLYTVGLLALGLGPLIALVLYYNLLDKIRKDLKRIAGM